jgi:DNA invertase Pin-like site-specific DNA recombinase
MRAAIYTRISRAEDRSGVERHTELCQALCDLRGYEVVGVYEDNDISATAKRPSYDRLVKDLASGRFDLVVAYEQTRLARDVTDWDKFLKAYVKASLQPIEFVRGGVTDLASPQGQLTSGIQSVTNAYEKAVIRQRILDKKAKDAVEGKFHGGSRPFGYEDGGMVIRESEAALLRVAADTILEGGSLSGIARLLNEQAIPTATGHKWRPQAVRRLLMSPRIAGIRQHQSVEIGPALWPPILEGATYRKVLAVLTDPARKPPRLSGARPYPLRGVLKCGECGRLLAIGYRKSAPMYECRKQVSGCGRVFISASVAETWAKGLLIPLADNPRMRNLLAEASGAEIEHIRELNALNASDTAKLTELGQAYASDAISLEILTKTGKLLEGHIAERNAQMAAMRGASALDRFGGSVAESWDGLTVDDQRSIILSIVEYITVARNKVNTGRRFDPHRLKPKWRVAAMVKLVDWEQLWPKVEAGVREIMERYPVLAERAR